MHTTTTKGIVGGFEFTVFQRNLKEWQERPWTYVCEWLQCQEQCIEHIPCYLSGLSPAHFFDNLSQNSCISDLNISGFAQTSVIYILKKRALHSVPPRVIGILVSRSFYNKVSELFLI